MTAALLGGALIGGAAGLMWVLNGRITGISGIVSQLLWPRAGEVRWRVAFLVGLLAVGLVSAWLAPDQLGAPTGSWLQLGGAGLLVGAGTYLGNGCTSGHGVCGIPRGSVRSWVATATFIGAGMITVWAVGGGV